ncbi:hypothetical protein BHE74_00001632 [Ensete ventricosum]|nr:hypothetical protein BHE74_00001632 [Ensete ventricosum]RZR77765.1 hypothetical protein BHM03_00002937 [Ensete ventricosum]
MGRHIAGRDKATAAAGRSKLLEVPLREVDHQASLPRQPYLPPGTGVPQLHTQRPPSTTTSGHSHLPLYFLLLLLFLDRVQIDPHDLFRPKAPGGERRKGREGKPKAGVAGHKNERKKGLKQEAAAATVEAAKQRSRSLCPSCRRLLLGPWRCFVPLPLSPSSYTNISFTRNQTEPLPIASSSTSWSVAFFYVSLPLSLSSYKNINFAKSRGQKRPATDAELPRNLCSIAPLQSCCKLPPISPCLRSSCFVLLPLFLLPPVARWKKRIRLWFRAVKVACLTE